MLREPAQASSTEVEEQTGVEVLDELEPLYDVVVIDNPVNTYEEVMAVVREALGCSFERAFEIAQEIDNTGSACVATVALAEARRIAAIIRRIGIEVRVERAA